MDALRQAADDIIESYQVQGLLRLEYEEAVEERMVRRYRGRPTSLRVERDMQVVAEVDAAALEQALRREGWQMYATNLPPGAPAVGRLVLAGTAARSGLERLSGRPVSLTPGSLSRDGVVVGLVRLLSLALRSLTLLEMLAYSQMHEEGGGQPQAAERRRAASAGERLLDTFRDIGLGGAQDAAPASLTALTPLQRRVLHLLALPQDLYEYRGR
jgi:hypothetical protein